MCHSKQTPEQMMASALRYTRGLALLSNPAYSFETIENCPTAFMVTKQDAAGVKQDGQAGICEFLLCRHRVFYVSERDGYG